MITDQVLAMRDLAMQLDLRRRPGDAELAARARARIAELELGEDTNGEAFVTGTLSVRDVQLNSF